jgi:CarD family transcriptional regulator
MKTLRGKAKVKKAMWSRRAQEYEQKINSGDLIAIAEVVRDLHRQDDQREQSYSERQLYEAALERLTREIAAVAGNDENAAAAEIESVLVSRAA